MNRQRQPLPDREALRIAGLNAANALRHFTGRIRYLIEEQPIVLR
jgi:hypothetical protein